MKTLALFFTLCCCSCMTTYDNFGRPIQSVDPAVATAGIIGYAIGNTNNENDFSYRRQRYDSYYNASRYENRHFVRPDRCGPYAYRNYYY